MNNMDLSRPLDVLVHLIFMSNLEATIYVILIGLFLLTKDFFNLVLIITWIILNSYSGRFEIDTNIYWAMLFCVGYFKIRNLETRLKNIEEKYQQIKFHSKVLPNEDDSTKFSKNSPRSMIKNKGVRSLKTRKFPNILENIFRVLY